MRQCEHKFSHSRLYQILQLPVKDFIRGGGINIKKKYYYRIFELLGWINKKEASTESISKGPDLIQIQSCVIEFRFYSPATSLGR
jgi:hypothetical protein